MEPGLVALVGTLVCAVFLKGFQYVLRQTAPKPIIEYSAKAVLAAVDNAGPIDWSNPKIVHEIHQRISAEISAYGAAKTLCHCEDCQYSRNWKARLEVAHHGMEKKEIEWDTWKKQYPRRYASDHRAVAPRIGMEKGKK